jgi:hypothetical protein
MRVTQTRGTTDFFVGGIVLWFELMASHLVGRRSTTWATALFCVGYFWDRVSKTICLGWLWTWILLISVSWVARITDTGHRRLAHTYISDRYLLGLLLILMAWTCYVFIDTASFCLGRAIPISPFTTSLASISSYSRHQRTSHTSCPVWAKNISLCFNLHFCDYCSIQLTYLLAIFMSLPIVHAYFSVGVPFFWFLGYYVK